MQNPGTIFFSCYRNYSDLKILSLFWDQQQSFWKTKFFPACQEFCHSVLASIFLAGHDHETTWASVNFLRLLVMEDQLCPWLFQERSLRTHWIFLQFNKHLLSIHLIGNNMKEMVPALLSFFLIFILIYFLVLVHWLRFHYNTEW